MVNTLSQAVAIVQRRGDGVVPAAVRRYIKRRVEGWAGWQTPVESHEKYLRIKKGILQKAGFEGVL